MKILNSETPHNQHDYAFNIFKIQYSKGRGEIQKKLERRETERKLKRENMRSETQSKRVQERERENTIKR